MKPKALEYIFIRGVKIPIEMYQGWVSGTFVIDKQIMDISDAAKYAEQFCAISDKQWLHLGNVQFTIINRVMYIHGTNDVQDLIDLIGGYKSQVNALIQFVVDYSDIVVGHSAGAAVAEQLSTMFDMPCVSFNPPNYQRRKEPLMKGCNKILRVVHRGDWVQFLPWLYRKMVARQVIKVGSYLGLLTFKRENHFMSTMARLLKASK